MAESEQSDKVAALQYVWGLYRTYAKTSRNVKARVVGWRWTVFILTILGAFFGTLSQQNFNAKDALASKVLGWMSAVSVGLAAYFSKNALSTERKHHWVRSRSAAEALKSEAYLYVTRTRPYDSENAADVLLEKAKELVEKNSDFSLETVTEAERLERIPKEELSLEEYIERRVEDQVGQYYYPRVRKNIETVNQANLVRFGLGAVAVVLGATGGLGLEWDMAGWVALITTITMGVAAFLFAGGYSYLALSYQSTAQRLEWLLARWNISDKAAEDKNTFITDCEQAISVENKRWLAEWGKKVKSAKEAVQ